uniref:Subtilisin-like protease fibronectin type-III domain-containing protein n=1 Tax=Ananas comosus var. bracteatus TaxID=296719 RepID=A0A6V7QFA4_ANACO|nr:unnamed protein product [Ananas comosus var. bracteatus]
MRHTTHQDAELAYGAGELNPIRARNPGLVYEPDIADYVNLLCTQYTADKVRLVTGEKTTCPKGSNWRVSELNYPTMSVPVSEGARFRTEFLRTVTNVGRPNSTYRVIVNPGSMNVNVRPRVLSFDKMGEKKSFVVTVSGVGPSRNVSLPAAIMWTDGRHHVRSPINAYLKW